MFRKLKRKFIIWNMGLLTLVFAAILAAAAVLMVLSNQRQTRQMLDRALFAPPGGRPPVMGTITVRTDPEGRIRKYIAPPQISAETVGQAAALALAQGESSGRIEFSSYDFAYAVQDERGEKRLVLIDQSSQKASLRNTLLILLGVSLLSLLLLFALSVYFANRAVRPVKESFEKQEAFLADASHELKTPLAILSANLAVVRENPGETVESQQKWLDVISGQTERMSELIRDMLTLARLDAEKAEPSGSADLSVLVSGAILSFEALVFEKGISLSSRVEDHLRVPGDEEKLRRLLDILLDNAARHTPEGGAISVNLQGEKGRVLLRVANTGAEIPPEALPHVFDRFYRADGARARESGGFGLGLAIAKSIVEEIHGKISASSSQNQTVFTVELRGSAF